MRRRSPATTCLLALLVGCAGETALFQLPDDSPPPHIAPQIELSSDLVHVGAMTQLEVRETTVSLRSVGTADLRIDGLELIGSTGWTILDPAATDLPRVYPPDTAWLLPLRYEPMVDPNPGGILRVHSNDPEQAIVEVQLRAEVRLPQIVLDPGSLDFGETAVGCSREATLLVQNIGEAPLRVDAIDVTGDESISMTEVLELPLWLEVGESRSVALGYEPSTVDQVVAAIIVESTDPDLPVAEAALFGARLDPDPIVDLFEGQEVLGVDILFVVDNSCSMGDDQTNLSSNFPVFMDQLEVLGVDYRLGVTTTDSSSLIGSPPVLDPSMSGASSTFTSRVNVGSGGSGWEQGFSPAVSALSGFVGTFPRPGSPLSIVVVSDEPEQSSGTVSSWLGQLEALLPSGFTWSGITGGESGCETALPAPRYAEMITATGGLDLPICAEDWASGLEQLADAAGELALTTFPLSGMPLPETIEVWVDDVAETGFAWLESGNRIVFNPDDAPAAGATVRVEYLEAPVCDG